MMPSVSDMTSFRWATVTSIIPLRIQLDGDTGPLGMTPDSLVDPFLLVVGSRVRVELSGRKCIIHGASNGANTSMESHEVINYNSNMWWYHEYQAATMTDQYAPAVVHRTSLGLVMAEGLLYSRVALPAGTVIATLSPEFRPLQRKRFFLSDAGTAGWGVSVETNGQIILQSAMPISTLISLSGISYNNDPNLTRRALVLNSGWATIPGEGVPQVAVDSLGRIFYEGCIQATTASPTQYFTPALNANEYNSQRGQLLMIHEFGTAMTMARMDATAAPLTTSLGRPSLGIPAFSAATKRSLDSINFNDATNTIWQPLPYLAGSNYANGWQEAGFWHAPDGAAHLRGLTNLPAPTASISQLKGAITPRYRQLFASENADSIGRFDIAASNGMLSNPTGKVGFYNLNHLTYWPLPIEAR